MLHQMKAILITLIFFTCSISAQTISFVHLGVSGKPMPNFSIVRGKSRTHEISPFHVILITTDRKIFEALKTYIRSNQPLQYDSGESLNVFGRYLITFTDEQGYPSSYELDIEDARVFFKNLLPLVKAHSELHTDVQDLIKRLG